MIQFGMPTLIENDTLQKNIDLCSRLGLRFIELNMNFPEYQTDCLENTDALIRAAEQASWFITCYFSELQLRHLQNGSKKSVTGLP